MNIYLRQLRAAASSLIGRRWLLAGMIPTIFISSWLLMSLAESGTDLVKPENYWWWFLVTSATVGYGDMFPKSNMGHVVGGYVIIAGIATVTLAIAQITNSLLLLRSRRLKGTRMTHRTGHVVLIGWDPLQGPIIIEELRRSTNSPSIVIVESPDRRTDHPLPEDHDTDFVCGPLNDVTTLNNAGMAHAMCAVVDVPGNDAKVAATVRRIRKMSQSIRIIAALHELRNADLTDDLSGVTCVQRELEHAIAGEIMHPGFSTIITDLQTGNGQSLHSMDVSVLVGRTIGRLQMVLKSNGNNATIVSLMRSGGCQANPGWDIPIEAGDILFYINEEEFGAKFVASLPKLVGG